ncbi:MAG TPA: hypothetical protein PLD01_16100 [Mycobacterium sp.]|nr:hypothetical protein [Mycobacterium sp.]
MAGGDDAAMERPFEGHFVVGGSGLYVTTECLGRTFASRTPNFALTIGLPRVGTNLDLVPAEIRERISEPAVPSKELVPPEWAYGPVDDTERMDEEHISPVWGGVMDDGRARTVYPESARESAVVYRCRFHTTLTAPSPGQQFDALAEEFLKELDDWWARFTSWVGILTRQDFVGLGGYPGGMTRSYPLVTWSVGTSGQRVDRQWRYYAPPHKSPMSKLQLRELEACVTAAGRNPPPPEWLFIRDARSLLQAGQARRAVLDAGTAAELAMTTLIDKYLDDTQVTDPGVRTAFGRFNNLVAKQEVLKFLRCGLLPERTRPDLIDLRNTAIHGRGRAGSGWEEVTLPQAQTAVEIATAIVEAAHPLASLLAQST